VCFVNAIRVVHGRAAISGTCRGCGRCITVCPQGAIEISVENERFVAESVARIAPLVDVT
jgi:Fe-S-cluster-containing hydrogenase component 2